MNVRETLQSWGQTINTLVFPMWMLHKRAPKLNSYPTKICVAVWFERETNKNNTLFVLGGFPILTHTHITQVEGVFFGSRDRMWNVLPLPTLRETNLQVHGSLLNVAMLVGRVIDVGCGRIVFLSALLLWWLKQQATILRGSPALPHPVAISSGFENPCIWSMCRSEDGLLVAWAMTIARLCDHAYFYLMHILYIYIYMYGGQTLLCIHYI